MKTVGLIVARSGSSRVPNKAMLDLAGRPSAGHIIDIARATNGLDEVWLATTSLNSDDVLARYVQSEGLPVFRGHPENVLDRLHDAAEASQADTVVYIGGDCPLLDPQVLVRGIEMFKSIGCDYLSNYDPPTYPGGMDVNVIAVSALRRAWERALAPSQRVHAFSYLTFHPLEFSIANVSHDTDLSSYHWAIDDPEDIDFVRAVYDRLPWRDRPLAMRDVLGLLASDETVRALHDRIRKPAVDHAFLASPHMMRDIYDDISILAARAARSLRDGDRANAMRLHEEIFWISKKLSSH